MLCLQAVTRIPDDEGLDECRPSLDLPSLAGGSKGTGPRLFCGHVPKVRCVLLAFAHPSGPASHCPAHH